MYRGQDRQTGQPVAVKALKPEIVASHPDMVERFVREGEALRQLNHPSIVKVLATVEEGGRHYMVMEFVGGGSLQELISQRGPLPIKQAVEIALDLTDALTRAHRLGIIHRDLKPANVLLAEDGTPRLSDFGVAYLADGARLTQAGMIVGTLAYLSPEACEGETLDTRSDIWAFGVMLFEMLTGRQPFAGETVNAILAAILRQPTPDLASFRTDVPDALADLLYRMLAKDPRERIPSVRLVGAELELLLQQVKANRDSEPLPIATPTPQPMMGTLTPSRRHNLPLQTTPFVGRQAELAALGQLLADPTVRLVTILGAGGMGKSRLALAAAERQLGSYEHGVYFVSLVLLESAENLLPAVARALNFTFSEGREPRQQLLDYLQHKNVLLLLDGFEQLPAATELVSDILRAAPGVYILATSRERLRLQNEQLFPIQGLDFPRQEEGPGRSLAVDEAANYAAVQLFLQGARRVRPGYQLNEGDLPALARICRLVQGMPLAILLAAAWVEMLSPAEIAEEIGQGLDFLETDLSDVPERHRSVRAIFDYSWNLLGEREQQVFRQLSVFRGGFTRPAAQQVSGASLQELITLVNKSLLHRDPAGRYEVHALLRQYAAEQLARWPEEERAARERHAAHYWEMLPQGDAELKGARAEVALVELEMELENIRLAWNWRIDQGRVTGLKEAADCLAYFYRRRGRFHEGEAIYRQTVGRLASLVTQAASPPAGLLQAQARLLAWQSNFSQSIGQSGPAGQLIQEAAAILERPELAGQDARAEKALILQQMAGVSRFAGRREEARHFYHESLALYRSLDDAWGEATSVEQLGWLAVHLGEYGEAHRLLGETLPLYQRLGNKYGIASTLWGLGVTLLYQGQFEAAEPLLQEALQIFRAIHFRQGLAQVLTSLGETAKLLGKFSEARTLLVESAGHFADLGSRFGVIQVQLLAAQADLYLGRYDEAQAQSSLAVLQGSHFRWGIGFGLFLLGCLQLVQDDAQGAWQSLEESAGVYQEIKQRDELSWALAAGSAAALALGNAELARPLLREALAIGLEIRGFVPLMLALPAAALSLADQGQAERAVELYALAGRHPFVANSQWFADVAGQRLEAVAATLPPEVVATARARGQAADLPETMANLVEELAGY